MSIKFLKENWAAMLIALFLIAVGILLLVNPATFASAILKIAGAVLILCGGWDILKYFRTEAADAAKGSGFFSGITLASVGAFCIFSGNWMERAFPVMAVVYGIMQILFGYRSLQRMVDLLRMKKKLWWTMAISAALSLLLGFIIALNSEMTMIGIWVFTGISMIIEGIYDCFALWMTFRDQ